MEPISLEDLALLEVLRRIDSGADLVDGDSAIRTRLVDGALATETGGVIGLTRAGIELCKSLQHRVAADAQAAKLLQERGGEGSSSHAA